VTDYAEGGPLPADALPQIEHPASFVIPFSSLDPQPRRVRLVWSRPLTAEEEADMQALMAAELRDHEDEQRTRYESHAWGGGEDGEECVACNVRWEDCDDDCGA
jgi:hypothetical protein